MNEEADREKARDKICGTLAELKLSREESIMFLQNVSIWISILSGIAIEDYEDIVKGVLQAYRYTEEKFEPLKEEIKRYLEDFKELKEKNKSTT